MGRELKNGLKQFLTVVGWLIILFAVVALIRFIVKSGVFR